MNDLSEWTGVASGFKYERVVRYSPAGALESLCRSLRARYKRGRSQRNVLEEWMIRTYAAVKFLLAATVKLSSAEYADSHGLQIVLPYLAYYGLFHASRAILLLVPEEAWRGGALLEETTHEKTRNVTANQLRSFSTQLREEYEVMAKRAMAAREVFSYRFPATGLKGRDFSGLAPQLDDVIGMCATLGEVAQLYSECLEAEFGDLKKNPEDLVEAPLKYYYEYEHKHVGS